MKYDAADLAIIETSLDVIPEPQRSLIQDLIDMVRELQDAVQDTTENEAKALERYRNGVSDASSLANKLTHELDDALREAKRMAAEIETELADLDS